ncbi:MAG TPA: hypothetical protein VMT53_15260 [Terriglobales bacterium]|nr:hypothetical protein [Terriglobales bacterium]
MLRRTLFLLVVAAAGFCLYHFGSPLAGNSDANPKSTSVSEALAAAPASSAQTNTADSSTEVLMHNVVLNDGPTLKLYVRWLRGWMRPTRSGITPSFDDPKSFALDISTGVVKVNLSDVAAALNSGMLQGSPLSKVSLAPSGKQLKVNGTVHKILPLPFEMVGDLGATPDGRIVMHVASFRVLKIPLKGILKVFDVKAGDLVGPKGAKGVQAAGNDIYFDPEQILPDPQKRGKLTDVHLKNADIVAVYGVARPEVVNHREWRNFIRLRGGSLDFGKLTMHKVDLVMIDVSDDEWFKFDLDHYQEQLVNGYSRMTPQAGLQIFMPDIDRIPHNRATQNISLEWARNRKIAPPPDVMR